VDRFDRILTNVLSEEAVDINSNAGFYRWCELVKQLTPEECRYTISTSGEISVGDFDDLSTLAELFVPQATDGDPFANVSDSYSDKYAIINMQSPQHLTPIHRKGWVVENSKWLLSMYIYNNQPLDDKPCHYVMNIGGDEITAHAEYNDNYFEETSADKVGRILIRKIFGDEQV